MAIIMIISSLFMASCTKSSKENNTSAVPAQSIKLLSGKVNLLFVTQDGCGACEYVKSLMQRESLKALLANRFNVIFIDISEVGELPKGLEAPYGTPTLYFVNSNGEQLIDPMIGGKDEIEFKDILDEAVSAYDTKYPAKEK